MRKIVPHFVNGQLVQSVTSKEAFNIINPASAMQMHYGLPVIS